MSDLLRDADGEPIMRLVERDRAGRFITPYYGYIWAAESPPAEEEAPKCTST